MVLFVREKSVNSMEFSDFFNIICSYMANPEDKKSNKQGRSEFLISLIDLMIRTPQTEVEDQMAADGELNPLSDKESDTISKYCSGSRKIPKAVAKEILKRISSGKSFIEKIDFAAPGAKESIRDEIRKQGFDVTSDSLGKICFDLMKAFLKKFTEGKSSVTASDMVDNQNDVTQYRLAEDVGWKCPLCGQELFRDGINKAVAGYDIVHIFPDNLKLKDKSKFSTIKKAPEKSDALDNRIPLCLSCANFYLENPTLENYQSLVNVKKSISNQRYLAKGLNQLTLEKDLIKVIKGLKVIKPDINDMFISYDAHKVEDKISSDYTLQGTVKYYVMGYYNKIRDEFSNMAGNSFYFDDLAATMKLAYIKLKREKLSQGEIFNQLANWILNKENLENEYLEAARIIVAFFVQNCEVFEVENAK